MTNIIGLYGGSDKRPPLFNTKKNTCKLYTTKVPLLTHTI